MPVPNPDKRYVTVREAANILCLHPESIRRAVRENKIPGARRVPGGRLIRIPSSYLEDLNGDRSRGGTAA